MYLHLEVAILFALSSSWIGKETLVPCLLQTVPGRFWFTCLYTDTQEWNLLLVLELELLCAQIR